MVNLRQYFDGDDYGVALRFSRLQIGLARLVKLHKPSVRQLCYCNGSALSHHLLEVPVCREWSFSRLPKRGSGQTCKRGCLRSWLSVDGMVVTCQVGITAAPNLAEDLSKR